MRISLDRINLKAAKQEKGTGSDGAGGGAT